jgi:hypothetical protein
MKPMLRLIFLAVATFAVVLPAAAAPKKYHFNLAQVAAKPEVKPDAAASATPRVEAKIKETFNTHKQLVGTLEGAPDWKTQAEAYRKFLAKKGIAGAYHVTVDISEASEELQPIEGRPKSQRLVVRVAIHMLGETMPGRTMGFTGDGQATIKVEIGKKLNEADRKYAWDEAAKAAIDDAMKTVFKQLAIPPKKQ